MDRRTFIGTMGCAVFTTMQASIAQQPTNVRRIGMLTAGTASALPPSMFEGLRSVGLVEGQNLIIERRAGNGKSETMPALAAELVQLQVEVIVTFGAVAGIAAKNATKSIPIVAVSGDPVRFGLVENMQHPGGNITGIALVSPELTGKRLELLRELLPSAVRIGELVDPANRYWQTLRKEHEQLFHSLRMQPIFAYVTNSGGVEAAMAELARERVEALNVRGDPIFLSSREQVANLAIRYAMPSVGEERTFAEAGLLMSYGAVAGPLGLRAAGLIDKILKGAKPGDLPIEQPTTFELTINMKTAKALGLTVPQALRRRADEVIQ